MTMASLGLLNVKRRRLSLFLLKWMAGRGDGPPVLHVRTTRSAGRSASEPWGSPRSTSRRFDGSAERKESVWVWKLR